MDMILLAQAAVEAAQQNAGLDSIGNPGIEILGSTLGTGITVLGAAKGIGNIAGKAVESIARQPEAGGRIGSTMLIAAALIEGFTFFAIVVCLMGVLKAG